MAKHTLSARERFLVSNFIINHFDELRALPSNDERIRLIEASLGMHLTQSNVDTAAKAAGVSLSPPPEKKAATVAELSKLVGELLERIGDLEVDVDMLGAGLAGHLSEQHDQPRLL